MKYDNKQLQEMADEFLFCYHSADDNRVNHMLMILQMTTGMNIDQIIYKLNILANWKEDK